MWIIDGSWRGDFEKPLEKRHKKNPRGEDVYLLPDGSIRRDEDAIIAAQRIWRERAYAPPGTPFEPRGVMYQKTLAAFNERATNNGMHIGIAINNAVLK
jgi:hypothetical protein